MRVASLFVGLAIAHGENWRLVRLTKAAQSKGAVCLDGSPGAYYIREPMTPSPTNGWMVFNEGGGWCNGPQNCYDRSLTGLGSSKDYPEAFSHYEGKDLFDAFPTFTIVYSMYCDGSSMTGNNESVTLVNGNAIYYRGRRILDALLDNLFEKGLNKAEQFLYAGCSAGALTTYENIDYVRTRLPSTTKMVGLADSMFSLHHASFTGRTNYYTKQFTWGYEAWNSSASVNQQCRMQFEDADGWMCFHGQVAAQFIETPLLIVNSKFDTWQRRGILSLDEDDCPGSIAADGSIELCDNSTDTSAQEWAFWSRYGDLMAESLSSVPRRHAAYLSNCPTHCLTSGWHWRDPAFPGTRLDAAVLQWFGWAMGDAGAPSWRDAPRWVAQHVYDQGCVHIAETVV